jgi:hypothetical protein
MQTLKLIAEMFLAVVAIGGILIGWYKFMVNAVSKKVRLQCHCDLMLLKDSSLANLMDGLERKCEYYINRGYATIENRKTISTMFRAYAGLGGNSFIEDLIEKVNSLPFNEL